MKNTLLVAAALFVSACGMSPLSSGPGGAGATPGGAKDLSLARAKVDAGEVPLVEDLPFEGLYSEHDLPLPGPACTDVLCLRTGTAVANDFDAGVPSAWVQLGLSSNVDLATFRRRPLNAAIVLDHSGSMGTDKMEAAKAAADKLIELLDENDVLTIVEFDDTSRVVVGPVAVTDKAMLHARVAGIHAAGSTCIECGLRDGFTKLTQAKDPARANRLFLFTDAQPNVGSTGAGDFMTQLTNAAAQELYVSIFGVGLDFGQELTTQISAVRGANARFLATPEETQKVFDEDFDLLVTPIAWDLTFTVTPTAPLAVSRVYGVPGEAGASFTSTVKTVFLSRKRGALLVQLDGVLPETGALGTVQLGWSPLEGERREATVSVERPAEGAAAPARKVVALTRMLTGLREACAQHHRGEATAAATGQAAVDLIRAEATAMGEADLTTEVDFATALQALLRR